jgi:urease accessory protein
VRAGLVVEVAEGRVRRLVVDPPLSVKLRRMRTPRAPVEIWLVGSAAALLEGDELSVQLDIGAGCRVVVRSVASQLAHPCPGSGWSTSCVRARVASGGSLSWAPEPVIVAAGARYRSRVDVDVAADGACTWRDEWILGRTGEDPDEIVVDGVVRIDVGGRPLVRDGVRSAAGWRGPAVLGGARYLGALHVANAAFAPSAGDGWFSLAGPGHSFRVLADDPVVGRRRLEEAELEVGCAT